MLAWRPWFQLGASKRQSLTDGSAKSDSDPNAKKVTEPTSTVQHTPKKVSNPHKVLPLLDGTERASRPAFADWLVKAEELALRRATPSDDERDYLDQVTSQLLIGANCDLDINALMGNRVLLFVSSTFTDTAWERNNNIADVYPYLRLFCSRLGLTFESVDMRWGVLDTSTAEHLTSELCMRQLQKCLDESAGPAFFSILGNKYGYRPFPPILPKEDFEAMQVELDRLCLLTDTELQARFAPTSKLIDAALLAEARDRNLLQFWWDLDLNAIPPVYVLKPSVDSQLAALWKNDEGKFMRLFRAASWDLDFHHTFVQSVTEDEVHHGRTNLDKFIGVQRHYTNIHDAFQSFLTPATNAHQTGPISDAERERLAHLKSLSNFVDSQWDPKTWSVNNMDIDAVSQLDRLKSDVSPLARRHFHVPWAPGSSSFEPDLEGNEAQEEYLREFADYFCEQVCDGIMKNEEKRLRIVDWDPLIFEILGGLKFRLWLANELDGDKFVERDCVASVKAVPGGVHLVAGAPGSGKSAILLEFKSQMAINDPDCVLISRFVGATEGAASICPLLASLCAHLLRVHNSDRSESVSALEEKLGFADAEIEWFEKLRTRFVEKGIFPSDLVYDDLVFLFENCLNLVAESKRVVLIIDSAHKLWNENERSLTWIPADLHQNASMVLSALEHAPFTQRLKKRLEASTSKTPLSETTIPDLTTNEISKIIDSLLARKSRTLSTIQREFVMRYCVAFPNPLFIHMAYRYFIAWSSYQEVPSFSIPNDFEGVPDSLTLFDAFLSRLEYRYGNVLVPRALGYLTVARRGLSSSELEDLLSLDDDVLNVVFQYWTPPLRRIPSALWVRIRDELEDLLSEISVDGATVYMWHRREFHDHVMNRYLSPELVALIHSNLSDYWSSKYAGQVPKEYKKSERQRDGSENVTAGSEVRYVADQPVFLNKLSTPNLRRLKAEPWHLMEAGRLVELSQLLQDPEYLAASVEAGETFLAQLVELYGYAIKRLDRLAGDSFPAGVAEFKKFLTSNFGRIAQGKDALVAIATDLPAGSHVGDAMRSWCMKQEELFWLDRANRPIFSLEKITVTPKLTMLDASKASASSVSGRCWLEWPTMGSGTRRVYATIGLRVDYFRVVTLWDINLGVRIANVTLAPENRPFDGEAIPLVCRASPDGSRFAIGSGCVTMLNVIGQSGGGSSDVDLILDNEVQTVVEDASFLRRIGNLKWSSDSKAVMSIVTFSSDVERFDLRDAATLDLIASWEAPFRELIHLGESGSNAVFVWKESKVVMLDVDEWQRNGGIPSLAETLQLPYPFSLDDLAFIDVSKATPKMLLVNPERELEVWSLTSQKRVARVPKIKVDKFLSVALNQDASRISLSEGAIVHLMDLEQDDESDDSIDSIYTHTCKLPSADVVSTSVASFAAFSGATIFAPDGRHFITTGENNSHLVWDLAQARQFDDDSSSMDELKGSANKAPSNPIQILGVFSSNGQLGFAVNEGYGTFQLISCESKKAGVLELVNPESGDVEGDMVLAANTHPYLPLLIATTKTKELIIANLSGFTNPTTVRIKIDKIITACAFMPQQTIPYVRIVTASDLGEVEIWKYTGADQMAVVSTFTHDDKGWIRTLTPSHDGMHLAVEYHMVPFCFIHDLSVPESDPLLIPTEENIARLVTAFNPTNSSSVAVSMNWYTGGGSLKLHNIETKQTSSLLTIDGVLDLAWTQDGTRLVSLSAEYKMIVYKISQASENDVIVAESASFIINSASPLNMGTICFSPNQECRIALLDLQNQFQAFKCMGNWSKAESRLPLELEWEDLGDDDSLWNDKTDDQKYSVERVTLHPLPENCHLNLVPGVHEVWGRVAESVSSQELFKDTTLSVFQKRGNEWAGIAGFEVLVKGSELDWSQPEVFADGSVQVLLGVVHVYCSGAIADVIASNLDMFDEIWMIPALFKLSNKRRKIGEADSMDMLSEDEAGDMQGEDDGEQVLDEELGDDACETTPEMDETLDDKVEQEASDDELGEGDPSPEAGEEDGAKPTDIVKSVEPGAKEAAP
ncbi:hypothetical protein BJ741DRAFT_606386 [Chytriomyces cf. hyalinus JEL632]|nr:hypothetical protein BJ741DRAFT_606386 [Chytriomyces cf. hyalinus JEL632]